MALPGRRLLLVVQCACVVDKDGGAARDDSGSPTGVRPGDTYGFVLAEGIVAPEAARRLLAAGQSSVVTVTAVDSPAGEIDLTIHDGVPTEATSFTGSVSADGRFVTQSASFRMGVGGIDTSVYDATFGGVFGEGPAPVDVQGGSFVALWDVGTLDDLPEAEGDACALAASLGTACSVCPDSEFHCLALGSVSLPVVAQD